MALTKQQVFDRVWNHFVRDGNAPSITPEGGCMYRRNGMASCPMRCAAGLFIPDDRYDPDMEGKNAARLLRDHPNAMPELTCVEGDTARYWGAFLNELQAVHDYAAKSARDARAITFKERIESRLRGIARAYQFEVPSKEV